MTQYGMVIDLERCVACGSCMLACKAEHHVPPGMFLIGAPASAPSRLPNGSKA